MTAIAIGAPTPNALARIDFIENEPLRHAVQQALADGQIRSWGELGALIGLSEDSIRRSLGAAGWSRRHVRHVSRYCRYDTAVGVVRELGLDPVDFGV